LFLLITGVASPREKSEIQQALEEQFDKSSSEDEGIWDVGINPVIETLLDQFFTTIPILLGHSVTLQIFLWQPLHCYKNVC
jgi:hypothetical protein